MSYEDLAERLIEAQRPMLGTRAVDVAQSVSGLAVTDDGEVTEIASPDPDRHDREVIDDLVAEYTSIMGQSAHDQLVVATEECDDDLVLPESLGGPETVPDTAHDGDDNRVSTSTQTTDATSGSKSQEFVTNIWDSKDADDGATGGDTKPVEVDIESVYVTVEDDGGWETPAPVRTVIVDAVTGATDIERDDVGDLSEYVDPDRIVRLFETDASDSLSFRIEGHEITLYPDGSTTID